MTKIIPANVLHFWFVESKPSQWFRKDEKYDEEIRKRFFDIHESIRKGETSDWRKTPEGRLAEVIVLDQFSRNMFRDDPRAFENDTLALKLAEEAIQMKDDKKLPRKERRFLYMPFMHSESLEKHRKGFWLFLSLFNWPVLRYELYHRNILRQFGRYPSRNKILGRKSTPEEERFLKSFKGF